MDKIDAFQYYLNAYINVTSNSPFFTLRAPFDTKNQLKLKHDNEISTLKIENMKIKQDMENVKELENTINKLKQQKKII